MQKPLSSYLTGFIKSLIVVLVFFPAILSGQDILDLDPSSKTDIDNLATVSIDGTDLFYVRGVLSFPAKLRAKFIEEKIYRVAQNNSISPSAIRSVAESDRIRIYAGNEMLFSVFDADGEVDGMTKDVFAEVIVKKLEQIITKHRYERSPEALKKGAIKAGIAFGVLILVLLLFSFIFKRLNNLFKKRMEAKMNEIENVSFKLIQSNKLVQAFHLLYKAVRLIIILFICVSFLNYFLGLFPWSRGISVTVLRAFLNPIQDFGKSFIDYLPSLITLIIIGFITRYILRFIKLLFSGISAGGIKLKNFDSDWAMPTFKIVRVLIIVFAFVIAFPYIPGSDTNAFKGISVFLGVLFSLGSSSFIANIVAGYSMTYQNAFKRGDYIQVNELKGFVEEQSSMVTRLRSHKNEEIVIPNSILLNSNVINYSLQAKQHDLILHTTVGIGYETPWRQVEAMLILAARRTEGLSKTPEPFVLKKELGDFAILYEINAYCIDESKIPRHYSLLHQNIIDVFNENDVAIMTPAYEGDPETPKVVPKDQWDTPLKDSE